MKITIDVTSYIEDLIDKNDDIVVKINKRELQKTLKKAFEEYLEDLVYSAFDCRDMEIGILDKLQNKGIIEYK